MSEDNFIINIEGEDDGLPCATRQHAAATTPLPDGGVRLQCPSCRATAQLAREQRTVGDLYRMPEHVKLPYLKNTAISYNPMPLLDILLNYRERIEALEQAKSGDAGDDTPAAWRERGREAAELEGEMRPPKAEYIKNASPRREMKPYVLEMYEREHEEWMLHRNLCVDAYLEAYYATWVEIQAKRYAIREQLLHTEP